MTAKPDNTLSYAQQINTNIVHHPNKKRLCVQSVVGVPVMNNYGSCGQQRLCKRPDRSELNL